MSRVDSPGRRSHVEDMSTVTFDTLTLARRLRDEAHFSPEDAEATARVLADTIGDSVVTREYLDLRLGETEMRLKHDLTLRLGAMLAASVAIVAALMKVH